MNALILKSRKIGVVDSNVDGMGRRRLLLGFFCKAVGLYFVSATDLLFAQAGVRPVSKSRGGTVYIDSSVAISGDGKSPAGALRSLPLSGKYQNKSILFRRGTTLNISSALRVVDCSIGAWGEGVAAPEIRVEDDQDACISVLEGDCWIEDIALLGSSKAKRRTNGVDATEASRLVIINCSIRGFFNGIKFCGDDGWIQGNNIADVANNGIFGGRHGNPAPSRTTIMDNVIDATGARNDGITLHDGTGTGLGNRLIGNRITGAYENGIDVQPPYQQTLIERNVIGGTSEYAILVAQKETANGGRGTRIVNNEITSGAAAGVYVFASGVDVVGNRVSGVLSTKGANAFLIAGDCNVLDNVVEVPEGNMRPVITIAPKPGVDRLTMRFEGNSISNASAQPMLHMARGKLTGAPARIDANFARNRFAATTTAGARFDGKRFEDWRAGAKAAHGIEVLDDAAPSTLPQGR